MDIFALPLFFAGENGPNHQLECSTLSKLDENCLPDFDKFTDESGITLFSVYAAILPLRMLKLKENTLVWERLDALMDHVKDMDKSERDKIQVTIKLEQGMVMVVVFLFFH